MQFLSNQWHRFHRTHLLFAFISFVLELFFRKNKNEIKMERTNWTLGRNPFRLTMMLAFFGWNYTVAPHAVRTQAFNRIVIKRLRTFIVILSFALNVHLFICVSHSFGIAIRTVNKLCAVTEKKPHRRVTEMNAMCDKCDFVICFDLPR